MAATHEPAGCTAWQAPTAISVGMTGRGRPSDAPSTLRKTNSAPYCAIHSCGGMGRFGGGGVTICLHDSSPRHGGSGGIRRCGGSACAVRVLQRRTHARGTARCAVDVAKDAWCCARDNNSRSRRIGVNDTTVRFPPRTYRALGASPTMPSSSFFHPRGTHERHP
ncbi:hypothetical protein D3C72_1435480 [compost metagenome]